MPWRCFTAWIAPAWAANEPVSGLGARGAVAGTDLLPDLPSGSASLQAVYASDLKKFALTSIDTYGADPTGVTDSTSAINAAIASGQSFSCNGVYKTTGSIVFSTTASHGQQLLGTGPTDAAGITTAGRCIIRPTSAVSVAVKVDGSPFSGYVEGFGIENVTIDMTSMPDVNTSIAFDQVQAYDGHYRNDRVINFGNSKLSWSFNAGSYTTKVEDSQGGVVSFAGLAYNNAATTITLINDDLLQIYHDFYQNVTLLGGAIQRPYSNAVSIIYLAPGTTPYAYLPNTGGLYAAVLSEIYDSLSFTSIGTDWEPGGGYPSTYNDGTHGTLNLIRVLKVDTTAIDTTFINPSFAGMYLLDYGTNTRLIGQQEGTSAGTDIHNGQEIELGSVGVVGSIFGFISLPNLLNTDSSITYTLNGSTGVANFLGESLQPSSDADGVFKVNTAAGLSMVDCATNALQCAINNATTLAGYSDTFTTQAWNLNIPSAGTAQLLLKHNGSTTITLTGANGTAVLHRRDQRDPSRRLDPFDRGVHDTVGKQRDHGKFRGSDLFERVQHWDADDHGIEHRHLSRPDRHHAGRDRRSNHAKREHRVELLGCGPYNRDRDDPRDRDDGHQRNLRTSRRRRQRRASVSVYGILRTGMVPYAGGNSEGSGVGDRLRRRVRLLCPLGLRPAIPSGDSCGGGRYSRWPDRNGLLRVSAAALPANRKSGAASIEFPADPSAPPRASVDGGLRLH